MKVLDLGFVYNFCVEVWSQKCVYIDDNVLSKPHGRSKVHTCNPQPNIDFPRSIHQQPSEIDYFFAILNNKLNKYQSNSKNYGIRTARVIYFSLRAVKFSLNSELFIFFIFRTGTGITTLPYLRIFVLENRSRTWYEQMRISWPHILLSFSGSFFSSMITPYNLDPRNDFGAQHLFLAVDNPQWMLSIR